MKKNLLLLLILSLLTISGATYSMDKKIKAPKKTLSAPVNTEVQNITGKKRARPEETTNRQEQEFNRETKQQKTLYAPIDPAPYLQLNIPLIPNTPLPPNIPPAKPAKLSFVISVKPHPPRSESIIEELPQKIRFFSIVMNFNPKRQQLLFNEVTHCIVRALVTQAVDNIIHTNLEKFYTCINILKKIVPMKDIASIYVDDDHILLFILKNTIKDSYQQDSMITTLVQYTLAFGRVSKKTGKYIHNCQFWTNYARAGLLERKLLETISNPEYT